METLISRQAFKSFYCVNLLGGACSSTFATAHVWAQRKNCKSWLAPSTKQEWESN